MKKLYLIKTNHLKAIKQISEKARNAEAVFPVKNIRTIVYVENLDDFLADQSSENRKKLPNGIDLQNMFLNNTTQQFFFNQTNLRNLKRLLLLHTE
ncbi:MAG: hypothetical protein L6V95_10835 [Candidatus Melainabacteria bacterium]|nr:MAG: hypothetical protein L6V95_10835 [Candidatus Melainabacteria bacterium]